MAAQKLLFSQTKELSQTAMMSPQRMHQIQLGVSKNKIGNCQPISCCTLKTLQYTGIVKPTLH